MNRDELLHKDDLVRIAKEAGLGDTADPTTFYETLGVCAPAVSQYGDALIEYAVHSDDDADTKLSGIWHSGVSLGLAVGLTLRGKLGANLPSDLEPFRAQLRSAHPSFVRIDEILVDLINDPRIAPETFELVCEAIFIALTAYAEQAAPA